MKEPPPTCPFIDAAIRRLRNARPSKVTMRDPDVPEDARDELSLAAEAMVQAEEDFERLRGANAELREWGDERDNLLRRVLFEAHLTPALRETIEKEVGDAR